MLCAPSMRPVPSHLISGTLLGVWLVLTSACAGRPSERPRQSPVPTHPQLSAPATVGSPKTLAPTGSDITPYALDAAPFATGFSAPLFATHAGDGSGRVFVVEQSGRVKAVSRTGEVAAGTFLDLSARVSSGGERGLLGLAFSPDYATDRQLFVDYTDVDGNTVVSRFISRSPDAGDAASEEIVLRIGQPAANHNGGWIGFGPDRMLYVATGDGGGGNSQNGQRLDTLLGKVLRIDVLGRRPYAIPPNNPDLGPGVMPEIWLYGLRNPWRMSFDRITGDLFIGDVGASTQEELDVIPAGQSGLNLGWPLAEGTTCQSPCPSGLTTPFFAYGRDVGSVVTGGYVYRGTAQPDLVDQYLFGDYARGTISTVSAMDAVRGTATPRQVLATDFAISSFGEDEDGELYLTDAGGGGVYHLVAATVQASP